MLYFMLYFYFCVAIVHDSDGGDDHEYTLTGPHEYSEVKKISKKNSKLPVCKSCYSMCMVNFNVGVCECVKLHCSHYF